MKRRRRRWRRWRTQDTSSLKLLFSFFLPLLGVFSPPTFESNRSNAKNYNILLFQTFCFTCDTFPIKSVPFNDFTWTALLACVCIARAFVQRFSWCRRQIKDNDRFEMMKVLRFIDGYCRPNECSTKTYMCSPPHGGQSQVQMSGWFCDWLRSSDDRKWAETNKCLDDLSNYLLIYHTRDSPKWRKRPFCGRSDWMRGHEATVHERKSVK